MPHVSPVLRDMGTRTRAAEDGSSRSCPRQFHNAEAPMPQTIDSITAIEQLAEQLRALESRVSALESLPERKADSVASPPLQGPRPATTRHPALPLDSLSGTLTVVGKAVLGMAGAYLFRALFELGTIPKLPVLFVAILYACFWMIRAVRTHTSSRFAS